MDEIRVPAMVFPDQRDSTSAFRVGYDLLAQRAPKEALEIIEPALGEEPGNTGLRMLRAWAFYLRVQLEKAETELLQLVEENPGDDWARHLLGRTLERQSRFTEAIGHLRLAAVMSGDPEHETAVLRVERRLAETGATSYDELR